MLKNAEKPDAKNFIIYIHTLNCKHYVGQTTMSLKARAGDKNFVGYKYSSRFYEAILKFGAENIKSDILYRCKDPNEANRLEQLCISRFNTLYPDGYNLEKGGKKFVNHHETEAKDGWQVFKFELDVFKKCRE